MWRTGWDDEGALREKVAEGNRQAEEYCARLRTEELKWGKPCFTYQKKNVAIVIPLKDACALSFFKGALLKDPKHILQKIGEHTQAGRWIKFTSPKEISALQPTLRNYIYEATQVEESGKKVVP